MPSCKRAELRPGEFLLRTAVISETMTVAHRLGPKRRRDWTHRFFFALEAVPRGASGSFAQARESSGVRPVIVNKYRNVDWD